MTWPAGMALCTFEFPDAVNSGGEAVDTTVTVELLAPFTSRLVWGESGTDLMPEPLVFTNVASAQFPFVDQDGIFSDRQQPYTNFAFRCTVTRRTLLTADTYSVVAQPLTGSPTVEVSRLLQTAIAAPVIGSSVVTNIAGLTGSVSKDALLALVGDIGVEDNGDQTFTITSLSSSPDLVVNDDNTYTLTF